MCTLVLLRRPDEAWPVIIGANRDEMIDRPWQEPARHWADRPDVVAGRDTLAGGSWLGINDHGLVVGVLNRRGSLGPAPGLRSRGELVLEALDHADAAAAADALAQIEPKAYRTFNLIIADNRDAFWVRHADPTGTLPVAVRPIAAGLAMIAAGDLDEPSPRITRYHPLFAAAAPPDPAAGRWDEWERLLSDSRDDPPGAENAMRFLTPRRFGTVSSALLALPAIGGAGERPRFRFAAWQPEASPWHDVPV